jgi:predicted nucleic acid-binding protein
MVDRTFVDSNVWVYTVDAADARKRALATAAVAPGPERNLVVSAQVLNEFYVVVTRKLETPLSEETAAGLVQQLAALPVVAIDASLVIAAIAGSRDWQISLWDALIVRAAAVAGCSRLLTEDLSDGAVYDGVRVENPFISVS